MANVTSNPAVSPIFNWLAIVPIAFVAVYFVGMHEAGGLAFTMLCIAAVSAIILYILQLISIKRAYPSRRLFAQLLLSVGTVVVCTVAALLGDILGAAHYNDAQDGISVVALGLIVGTFLAALYAYVLYLGNLIFVRNAGSITQLFKVFGVILYTLAWLAVAIVSFYVYSLIYSLHDPSTE